MKKMLFSAAALLCSVAALAQTPAPSSSATPNAPKAEREHKVKTKQRDAEGNDDHDGDKVGQPDNHGRNVSTFTKSTTLTWADKGTDVSAVARGGRGVDHSLRSARGGEHGEHGARGRRATGSSHAAGGHAGAGHGRGH